MIKRTASLRYSKALFDQNKDKAELERRLFNFEFIQELIKVQPKLMKFFKAPQIELQDKKTLLKSCLKDQCDPLFLSFLYMLLDKGRWRDLPQVASEYRILVNDYLGIWDAKMITATAIGPEIEQRLKDKLENFYQKRIKIKNEPDPTIIGGAILVIANEMIDWSISGRLKKIKENLLATNA